MVDVDQSYPSGGILELMVLAVRREIDICSLPDSIVDELRSASSAKGYTLNESIVWFRIADVRAL